MGMNGRVLITVVTLSLSAAGCTTPQLALPTPRYDFQTVYLNDELPRPTGRRVRSPAKTDRAPRVASAPRDAAPRQVVSRSPRRSTATISVIPSQRAAAPSVAPHRPVPTPSGSSERPRPVLAIAPAKPVSSAPERAPSVSSKVTRKPATEAKSEPSQPAPFPDVTLPRLPERAEPGGLPERADAEPEALPDVSLPPLPARQKGLVLGDGSVGGELVAAATRLIGLGAEMGPETFLTHLERTASVSLPSAASGGGRVAALWRGLLDGERTFTWEPEQIQPGDLVFFDGVADVDGDGVPDPLSGVGIVERLIGNQTVVCIAPVLGAVRRVPLTPTRPSVRRDGGKVLNVPVRLRRRGDGPDQGSLSGQVLVGFGRP